MERETNYYLSTHWLDGSLILCNDVYKIDPDLEYEFDFYNEEEDSYTEICQWYLTSYNQSEVEWLQKSFGLLFAYSPLLDVYVLCVDHWGTSWDYVYCPCYNDDINEENLKKKSYRRIWE